MQVRSHHLNYLKIKQVASELANLPSTGLKQYGFFFPLFLPFILFGLIGLLGVFDFAIHFSIRGRHLVKDEYPVLSNSLDCRQDYLLAIDTMHGREEPRRQMNIRKYANV